MAEPAKSQYYGLILHNCKTVFKIDKNGKLMGLRDLDKKSYRSWGRTWAVLGGDGGVVDDEKAVDWHLDALHLIEEEVDGLFRREHERQTKAGEEGHVYVPTKATVVQMRQAARDRVQINLAIAHSTWLMGVIHAQME